HGAAISRLDARADLYSLGIVMGELLAGISVPKDLTALLDRAVEPKPEQRFVSARVFASVLEGNQELRAIQESLPQNGKILTLAEKRPLLWLTVLGAIPQILACAVGISYNSLRIVSRLSPAQEKIFHFLCNTYNPILYTFAILLWIKLV